jgi:hypothetical protein
MTIVGRVPLLAKATNRLRGMAKSSPIADLTPTKFRQWMHLLRDVRGSQPLWPRLLGAALDAEFLIQRELETGYSGKVFINRDNHPLEDGEREERLVGRLYRSARSGDGCISIDGERIWLLGYQWPTQGGYAEKGRRADLIGMSVSGSLVVLEAKAANGDAPLIAVLEGLDYLACLLRRKNFEQIATGFQEWRSVAGRVIPIGFEHVVPIREARPSLIIVAPEAYFAGRHARSIRSRDWPYLAKIGETWIPSVHLAFAATDFRSTVLSPMRAIPS